MKAPAGGDGQRWFFRCWWRTSGGSRHLRSNSPFFFLLPLLLLLPSAPADTLELLDGRTFTGRVSLAADAVVISNEGAGGLRFPLASLRRLFFAPASPVAAPIPPNLWQGQSVGSRPVTGGFTRSNETFVVSSSGNGKRLADGHYFVWDKLGLQAELITFVPPQVVTRKEGERYKSAGIEFRAQLAGEGTRASLFVEGTHNVVMQTRTSDGKEKSRFQSIASRGVWLRLVRNDLQITAATSADGEVWRELWTGYVALPGSAFGGLVLCGAKSDGECAVAFQHVRFRKALGAVLALPELALWDGGVLAGRLLGADDSVVRWARGDREWNVSLVNVSRLVFQPGARTLMSRVRPGRLGALLISGDFVDGTLTSADRSQVRISSVLFGIRAYAVAGDLVAVYLQEAVVSPLEFEVQLTDGSRLQLREVALREGAITARERSLGELIFSSGEITELRRTAGR